MVPFWDFLFDQAVQSYTSGGLRPKLNVIAWVRRLSGGCGQAEAGGPDAVFLEDHKGIALVAFVVEVGRREGLTGGLAALGVEDFGAEGVAQVVNKGGFDGPGFDTFEVVIAVFVAHYHW